MMMKIIIIIISIIIIIISGLFFTASNPHYCTSIVQLNTSTTGTILHNRPPGGKSLEEALQAGPGHHARCPNCC